MYAALVVSSEAFTAGGAGFRGDAGFADRVSFGFTADETVPELFVCPAVPARGFGGAVVELWVWVACVCVAALAAGIDADCGDGIVRGAAGLVCAAAGGEAGDGDAEGAGVVGGWA